MQKIVKSQTYVIIMFLSNLHMHRVMFLNQYSLIKIVILFLIFRHINITSNFILFLTCLMFLLLFLFLTLCLTLDPILYLILFLIPSNLFSDYIFLISFIVLCSQGMYETQSLLLFLAGSLFLLQFPCYSLFVPQSSFDVPNLVLSFLFLTHPTFMLLYCSFFMNL